VEKEIGAPISPYAVTKLVNELYASVFAKTYDMQFIGLRYFNVFGPKQNPNGAYAAVIPLFIKLLLENKAPLINGDGFHSRDFTYIANVVEANIKSMFCENTKAWNEVYNIACGERTSLLALFNVLKEYTKSNLQAEFGPRRLGDIKHSLADISKAKHLLGYYPTVSVREGLKKSVEYFQNQLLVKV